MNSTFVLTILFIVGCVFQQIQGQCMTAFGGPGQCKAIHKCPPLLAMLKNKNKGSQDIDILRRSNCGYVGAIPEVCCPEQKPEQNPSPPSNDCYTPDYNLGKCVDLYSCPHLANLLKEPVSPQNIQYVKSFKCNGPGPYSVCCEPATDKFGSIPKSHCKTSVSAVPPDPASKCCGYDASDGNKIFDGHKVRIDEYPWLVLIEYDGNPHTRPLCGGSLISGRYVVTAAHCVFEKLLRTGKPVRVRLGEYDKDHEGPDCVPAESGGEDCTDGAIRIDIEKVIPHPDYNPDSISNWNDIALIRLKRLAPYTEFIRPICLPRTDITLRPDSSYNLTTSGWGAISNRVRSSSAKLYVNLPFIFRDKCQEMYNRLPGNIRFWEGQLCAGGEEGKDSCKGDSGGPLMHLMGRRHDLIGIASFGHKQCGSKDVPGVYTNVYKYIDWIRRNISP